MKNILRFMTLLGLLAAFAFPQVAMAHAHPPRIGHLQSFIRIQGPLQGQLM